MHNVTETKKSAGGLDATVTETQMSSMATMRSVTETEGPSRDGDTA